MVVDEREALRRQVEGAMAEAGLDERELLVLRLRFGLEPQEDGSPGEALSLKEVGRRLDPAVVGERVRQIEVIALRKLRYAGARDQERKAS
jgi:DNA-directed RNA polymerase sigma subunit (sigma70/sigma32)